MPIREFHCSKCHEDFEELVSGNTVPSCSSCGSIIVEPLMSRCCSQTAGAMARSNIAGTSSCGECSGGHCSSCH